MCMNFYVVSLLLLSTCTVLTIENNSKHLVNYVIVQDYFLGFKAPEYSVFNQSEKHLHYRIESMYDIQHNIKVVSYPSKKVLAKLRSKKQGKAYEAKISIRNMTSKDWSHGTIIQHRNWLHKNYSIAWNGYEISMINRVASLTTQFSDKARNDLLAQFHRRLISRLFTYDLEIFSDTIPESLYLLGLAVMSRGHNG